MPKEYNPQYINYDEGAGWYPDELPDYSGGDRIPASEDPLTIIGYGQFPLGEQPYLQAPAEFDLGGGSWSRIFTRPMGETVLVLRDHTGNTEVYSLERGVDPWIAPQMNVQEIEELMKQAEDTTNPIRNGDMHVMWPGNQENLSGKQLEIWQLTQILSTIRDNSHKEQIIKRLRELTA